jgi:hypothetical protein
MPYPDIQQQHNLFMGDIVAAWSDDRYSVTGTGFLMMRRTSCGPFTMSLAGSSMPSAKAAIRSDRVGLTSPVMKITDEMSARQSG